MKLLLIVLLTIFSSCQFPSIEPQERCVIVLEFDKCRCHTYDLMTDRRMSDSVDKELTYCDKLIGFPPDSWGNIKIWLNEIKIWRGQRKAKNGNTDKRV